MPCYTPEPEMSSNEYVKKMLCAACKFLTKEQISSINVSTEYIGLLEWYGSHLLSDYSSNYLAGNMEEVEIADNEAKRLGYKITKDPKYNSVFSIEQEGDAR